MGLEPPAGHVVRGATLEDASALAELFNACTRGEAGVEWTNAEEIRADLTAPDFDLENDSALVFEVAGHLVAGLVVYPNGPPVTDVFALGLVHPDTWGRGLGTFVTLLGEEPARRKLAFAPPVGCVTVHGSRFVQNEDAALLFRNLGYERVRTWWRMSIELDRDVPAAVRPEGIEVLPLDLRGGLRRAYDALAEAFRDHWGEGLHSYDNWATRVAGRGGERPAFGFVVLEGEQIAGVIVCREGSGADTSTGSIEELGVRRPWRGRGLGLTLLRAGFDELRRRGMSRAILSVDSENPTGATRLYERAGMHVDLAWDRWEKELREGAR